MNKELKAAIAEWQRNNGKTISLAKMAEYRKTIGFDPIKAIESGNYEHAANDAKRIFDELKVRPTIAYINLITLDYHLRRLVAPAHPSDKWATIMLFERELLQQRFPYALEADNWMSMLITEDNLPQ